MIKLEPLNDFDSIYSLVISTEGRNLMRFIFPAALILALLLPGAARGRDAILYEGDVTFDDVTSYLLLPFTVPPETTTIEVSYDYTWPCEPEGGKGLVDPVLDIGIYDPEKFRGWTGSAKSSFVLSESRDLTTDGYAPGEIPPGNWYIELGVGFVYPDMVMHYTVEIELRGDSVGTPFVWPGKEDVVLSDEARWYRGDLHCHSTHSDGQYPMGDVFDYARSVGLDFIALTDHNGFSHWLELPEMQAAYPDLLLLYGEEMTTYRGHANVYDVYRYVDYHGTSPGYDINALIEGIHDDGGYFSPNHPVLPFVPFGDSFIGWGWAYPETDWNLVDFFEVVNGPSAVYDTIPNVLNTIATLWWEDLLNRGYRITAIGGSDDHAAGQGGGPTYAPIGVPTNVVYAEELSPAGIFEAIKAGRVYIIAEGPGGPEIGFTARCGSQSAMIGDSITGSPIEFRVDVTGGMGRTLRLWNNGTPWLLHGPVEIDRDPFVHTFAVTPFKEGRIRVELTDGLYLSALTNPIYFRPTGGCSVMAAAGERTALWPLLFLPMGIMLLTCAGRVRLDRRLPLS